MKDNQGIKAATDEVIKALYEIRDPQKITLNYETYMKVATAYRNINRFEDIDPHTKKFMGIPIECVPDQKENVIIT
ncbi:hypothetical protein [Paenibacillus sp. SI8]|uniref:hypothetical protein n=1 Tax=unclassified Paenibacillus TaxID=185978 RepID=UPI0034670D7C